MNEKNDTNNEEQLDFMEYLKEEKDCLLHAFANNEIDREEYSMELDKLDIRMKVNIWT